MVTSSLRLKNMVSGSCIRLVRLLLENSEASVKAIRLGNVEFEYDPLAHSEPFSIEMLSTEGFEPIASREE